MSKQKSIFSKILFILIISTYILHAGTQFIEVEQELEKRNYTKAKQLFTELKNKYKSKRYDIRNMEKDTIPFLKLVDTNFEYMKNCKSYTCNQINTGKLNSKFKLLKYSAKYYSKDFKNKLYNLYITSFEKSNEYNTLIIGIKNKHQDKLSADRKKQKLMKEDKERDYQIKFQQEQKKKLEAQKNYEKELKDKKADATRENNRIDLLSKELGYKGYSKMNISQLIYKTQKNGGLENYINTVVGCSALDKVACKRLNSKLKILQILNNGLIYNFYKYINNEVFDFIIFTNKEENKIYQEKQKIDDGFYVFKGMITYKTILGVNKTIPKFEKVYIK